MGGALALEVAQVLKKENEEILFLGMFDTLGPEYHFQTESPEVDSRSAYLPHPGLLSRVTTKWPNNRASSILSHIINLTAYHLFKIIRKPRPEDLRQWLMVYCNFNCLHTYETRPYSGKITLFRSSYSNIKDRFYGWQDIAKGGVQIINIPAHHGSFVESPDLGKELNLHLMNIVKND